MFNRVRDCVSFLWCFLDAKSDGVHATQHEQKYTALNMSVMGDWCLYVLKGGFLN